MKSLFRGALIASLLATPALANEPSTDLEKLSYSLGVIIGSQMSPSAFGTIDYEVLADGIRDASEGNELKMEKGQIQEVVRSAQQKREELQAQKMLEDGERFLVANAKNDGVKTTPSGLQYLVLSEGDGPTPKPDDVVKVHYEGRFVDGKKFDSSLDRGEPIEFQLDQVIKGWQEGLQLMKVGSKYQLVIPSRLAYGPEGQVDPRTGRALMPPNAVLIFEVELLGINPEK
jgi:FKBP-type peptidyl-prolyl cis-trans isomerase FklB